MINELSLKKVIEKDRRDQFSDKLLKKVIRKFGG